MCCADIRNRLKVNGKGCGGARGSPWEFCISQRKVQIDPLWLMASWKSNDSFKRGETQLGGFERKEHYLGLQGCYLKDLAFGLE